MNPDKGNLHTTTQRVSQVGRASEAPPPRPPSAPPLAPLGRPRSQPPLCFRTQLAAAGRLLPSALAHSRHIQTAGVWLAGSQEKYVEEVGCRRRRKAAIHGHRGVFIRFGCWFFSADCQPRIGQRFKNRRTLYNAVLTILYGNISDAIKRFIAAAFERRSRARDAPHQSRCFRVALFYIGSHLSVKARRGPSDPRQNTSALKFSQATSETLKRPATHIPQFGVGG